MRKVEWVDSYGYRRASLLRDDDPDEIRESGVLVGPPNLDRLDWDEIKRDLHNELFKRGLFTWHDVQARQTGVKGAVLAVLRKRVAMLYREV